MGAGALGLGMEAMKSMTPKPPSIPTPPPPLQQPSGEAAAANVAARAKGAMGPGSTIATGPQGLTLPATTANKTLLGQ